MTFFRAQAIICLLVCLLPAEDGYACSCSVVESVAEAYEGSATVFVGTVTRIKDAQGGWASARRKLLDWFFSAIGKWPQWWEEELQEWYQTAWYGRDVDLDVDGYWKGLPVPTIRIRTGYGSGDCGYPFEVGRKYRVYATVESRPPASGGPPVAPYSYLVTSICHRTIDEHSARHEDLPPGPFVYVIR